MSKITKTNATVSNLLCAIDRALNSFGECVVQLRTIARTEGVDTTDRKATSAWLTPHIAAHYGLEKLSRESEAANQYRHRVAKAIVGDSAPQRVAPKVAVPRALQQQVAALLQQYDAATIREALKRAAA
jgi:AraC-like DNA-binding protein